MTAFAEMLAECMAGWGRDRTLRIDGDSRPWADVVDRAFRLAAGLVQLGIGRDDTVALYVATSFDAVEAWFASSAIGCMDVPLNVHYQGESLRYLLNDSRATVLFCDGQAVDRAIAAAVDTSVRTLVVCGDYPGASDPHAGGPASHRIDDLRASSPIEALHTASTARGVILYTSGTTGPSKGVLHSQLSCLELARYCARMNGYGSDDTLLNFFPLYHQNARYTGVGAALVSGASMQLDSKFTSSRFWEVCREGGVTAFNYLGSVLDMITQASSGLDQRAARDHPVTRAWGAGADTQTWLHFEQRFGVTLNEVYGLTEAPMATVNYAAVRAPAGSAGRESELFEVKIADAAGRIVGPGEVGEIVVRPKTPHGFMLGYYGREADTVAATRNLWFHTGDVGSLSDGCLYFRERTKDSVRRRGENISLWEVETALSRQPGVLHSAAYGVSVGDLDMEVMAAVVLADDSVDLAEILRGAMADLPGYAVPRYLRVVPELPHTDTMKVQKQALRVQGITPDTLRLDDILPPGRSR